MKILVWNEFAHEKTDERVCAIYPDGIHATIAAFLREEGHEVLTATLDDEGCGLSEELLDTVDVLIWWGHIRHADVPDAVAASAGLTKYHFLRKFKRITGLTVPEYINTVRCQHARQLLAGGASAKEAATRSGFGNFSHFSSVFKKYTGSLPSEIINRKSP